MAAQQPSSAQVSAHLLVAGHVIGRWQLSVLLGASAHACLTGHAQTVAGAATGLDALRGIQSRELRRQAAKQQLATAAQQLLQDPEKQLPQLKALLELMQDEDAQVPRSKWQRGWACQNTCSSGSLLGSSCWSACRRQACTAPLPLPAGLPPHHADAAGGVP